jgi:hypothetical protein
MSTLVFSEQLKYAELVAIYKLLGEKSIPETFWGYLKREIETIKSERIVKLLDCIKMNAKYGNDDFVLPEDFREKGLSFCEVDENLTLEELFEVYRKIDMKLMNRYHLTYKNVNELLQILIEEKEGELKLKKQQEEREQSNMRRILISAFVIGEHYIYIKDISDELKQKITEILGMDISNTITTFNSIEKDLEKYIKIDAYLKEIVDDDKIKRLLKYTYENYRDIYDKAFMPD